MATATLVQEVEPEHLAWFTVQDDDGKTWRYERRGGLSLDTPAHVEGQYFGGESIRTALVRDEDSVALLGQDGPGLPARIVVDYVSPVLGGRGAAYWSGKVEFELVSE
jgi:hypothetical protein